GACRGNPGPGGWGALLRYSGHEREYFGAEALTTNNRMELTAAIEALDALKEPCRAQLHTDPQHVRDGLTKGLPAWSRRGWKTASKTPVKNADLWQRLDAAARRHDVSWHWVRGHSGVEGNELADRLANRAIDELLESVGAGARA